MIIPPWVYAAAAAIAVGAGFYAGWTTQGWRCDAAKAEALEQQQRRFNEQLVNLQTEAAKYEQDRQASHDAHRARETEIRTIYRDVEVPADCEPPADVGRVLDNALESANARTVGQPGAAVPPASAEAAALR